MARQVVVPVPITRVEFSSRVGISADKEPLRDLNLGGGFFATVLEGFSGLRIFEREPGTIGADAGYLSGGDYSRGRPRRLEIRMIDGRIFEVDVPALNESDVTIVFPSGEKTRLSKFAISISFPYVLIGEDW